ncbi:hypothetical protein [Roseateles sp. P5_E11]
MTTPEVSAQVDALAIAFVEMAKMLGRSQKLNVMQLATAIETAARTCPDEGAKAASAELARRLKL